MDRVLVTGAAGRIGSLLVSHFKTIETEVFALDRTAAEGVLSFDLTQGAERIFDFLKPLGVDVIFHSAGIFRGRTPADFLPNTQMIEGLTQAIAQLPISKRPRLVNLSSAAELGVVSDQDLPVDESFECKPVSLYGKSKFEQTQIALAASLRFGFSCVCPRVFNLLWLPGRPPQIVQGWAEKLLEIKHGQREPILEVGDLSITRDFVDTHEMIRLIVQLAQNPNAQGVVNVASGVECRLSDVLEKLAAMMGVKFEIRVVSEFCDPQGPMRVVGDTATLRRLVSDFHEFELEKGLKVTLAELSEHHRNL